ncbi:copper resistance CopC family protein [Streptomyces sp. ATCC 21386]|uniref:copper resistance CopC family protein n=1 Tax=Streptomyces sp. ATCC 21386 TaxID=2699428 RepID=UPI001BFEF662|nr:copper resistance CopC family protein [Streptomyces sp. ATCC 21386]
MRRLRLLTTVAGSAACAGVLLLQGAAPAHAHTALRNAAPAPGATVGTQTDVVRLTFDNLTSGVAPKIRMIGPDGKEIPVGKPVVTDRTTACAAVSPLPEGVITLTYSIVAGDGDAQDSAFQFEAAEGGEPADTAPACADLSLSAPDTGGSTGTVLGLGRTTATAALAGAVAVVAGGGFLAVRTVRRRRTAEGRDGG